MLKKMSLNISKAELVSSDLPKTHLVHELKIKANGKKALSNWSSQIPWNWYR